MFDNNLRENKKILYRLQRQFGVPVVFRFPTQNDYDVTTGAITRAYTEVKVRRTIVLPTRATRDFVYDLAYIASNKNFTEGGYFDKTTRNMIVLKKDLKGNEPDLEWECTYKSKQYVIKELNETEDGAGVIMICNYLDTETA